jgi:hypothetical protein
MLMLGFVLAKESLELEINVIGAKKPFTTIFPTIGANMELVKRNSVGDKYD